MMKQRDKQNIKTGQIYVEELFASWPIVSVYFGTPTGISSTGLRRCSSPFDKSL